MALRALLTIWVAASELTSPGTQSFVNTAREALGDRVELRVETIREGDAERPATPAGSGVVELHWDPGTPGGAHLHVYLPTSHRWIDRSVTFDPNDPPAERGRTLGFVVASIFTDSASAPRPAPEPALAPVPVLVPVPVPVPVDRERPSPASRDERSGRAGAAAAFVAVGPGDATGFGARLVLDIGLLEALRIGIAGEGRFGTLPAAQASSRFLAVGGQVTWAAWRPGAYSWLGPSLAVYAAEIRVTRLAEAGADATPSQSHWVPAFEPALSGGLWIGGASAAFAEVGAEILGGRTMVVVQGEPRARFGLVAPAARLGLRTEF